MIVLHYTVIPTCEEALVRLSETTNSAGKVSAHYLVDRDGSTYNLVNESKRAWHAGLGSWAGLDDINSRSIGIEIVNVGLTEDGKREPFPMAQIDAVIKLCKDIQSRYPIKYVLGHSDVAPLRKQDPGEAFPWKKLAEAGIGIWTDAFAVPKESVSEMLAGIGYDVSDIDKATIAFQRHWYPEAITEGATNTVGRIAAIYDIIQGKETEL
jgi:N-acetylmuramoyl-L-alanine amidase